MLEAFLADHPVEVPVALPGERGRVLVVDDDRAVVETCTRAIQSLPLSIVSAVDGRQALAAAQAARFRLLLIELELPDIPGLEVVRAMRAEGVETPFIVMSGYATVPVAVEAMALGALDVLEKPLRLDDLRQAVTRAIDSSAIASHPGPRALSAPSPKSGATHVDVLLPFAEPRTPIERWCDFVIALISSDQDLKTHGAWAKHLGVSVSVLRETCRLVHIAPHDARDFARMLRAIWRCDGVWKPEMLLNVADSRTLKKLEARSGFKGGLHPLAPTVEEFFQRQRWIAPDNPALLRLRTLVIERRRQ